MKLTKYEHACIVLEEQGKKLVIDPGAFSKSFSASSDIAAVVVTHVHGDHFNPEHLQAIVSSNPDVKVFTTPEVANQWADPRAVSVKNGDEQIVGPFTLRFYGDLHQLIHANWAPNQNIAVMVNNRFYYPGDSFTMPDHEVELLALPANAPWAKVGESIDFMKAVKPAQFIRTHDGLLNKDGLMVTDTWFDMASEKFGPKYMAVDPGDALEF